MDQMKMMDRQKLLQELLKKKGIQVPGTQEGAIVKRDDPGPYELSYAQRRIWFLHEFDPGSPAYNNPVALRIKGKLNIDILQRTVNEIVHRHEIFQMSFPGKDGLPSQVRSAKDINIQVPVIPLTAEPGTTVEDQCRDFVNRFSRQPFDLTADLLIRVALLKINDDDYVFALNMHHIISDGWSQGILVKEFQTIYGAFLENQPSPLRELAFQYTDYVYWHGQMMKGERFHAQLSYWKNKLAGARQILDLPIDFQRSPIQTSNGTLQLFTVNESCARGLKALAQKQGVTLFMLLMASFSTFLFRCTGQEDFLIGTPIAGRNKSELEDIIGLFLNTLVLRTELPGDMTFSSLLGQVKKTALEAYANQDIPFEKLVEELNPRRNLSYSPLFQVMFQLQNAPLPPMDTAGLTITQVQVDAGFSQVDLSLSFWQENDILQGTFEYNTDLFAHSTIMRMMANYQLLLNGICENPGQTLYQLPILSPEEKEQILIQWNSMDAEYPGDLCIHELFERCVEKNPQETAVIFDNKKLSYGELNVQANRLANLLKKNNVRPETLVGICMDNSFSLITGIIAILKAGGAYIPMDPSYPDKRIATILKDAGSPLLITQERYLERFQWWEKDRGGRVIGIELSETEWEANLKNEARPENTACVIFTSGSTGVPKGILIEHRNIVNLIHSFLYSYHPGVEDRILPLTSIASASFVGEILPVLVSGGAIVLADKVHFLDFKKLRELLIQNDITIISTVPSLIVRLDEDGWKTGKLRLLLSGGEALTPGDISHLIDQVTIVNGYGLTEATICSTYLSVNEYKTDFSKFPLIPVGKPIINTQVYILDKALNPVPIGVSGEIYIAGDGVSRGYLNNPELTEKKFGPQITLMTQMSQIKNKSFYRGLRGAVFSKRAPLIYKTGDLGCWMPDGMIKFSGRIDRQVKVHGHRIELTDIEAALGLHPDVRDVVVIDRDLTPNDKHLVAYMTPKNEPKNENDRKPGADELREWLGKRMPEHMIPTMFEWLETIPLNPNGKVDINALPVLKKIRPDLNVDFKAPQTGIEREIAVIWQEFLPVEEVGIEDNFFDLGGHSLLLTQVQSRLNNKYQKGLTIVDLFRYPTIHSLAAYINEGEAHQADTNKKIKERATKQRELFSNLNSKNSMASRLNRRRPR